MNGLSIDYKAMQEYMELHMSQLQKNDIQTLVDAATVSPLIPNNHLTAFLLYDLEIDIFKYNLTRIPTCMFLSLPISELVIPDGIVSIESGAFAKCTDLKSITLPKTLKKLAYNAFDGIPNNSKLKIYVPKEALENGIIELQMITDEDGNEIPDMEDKFNIFWKNHVKKI